MRISIETSRPSLVNELFKIMTTQHDKCVLNNENTSTIEITKNSSFVELLNYLRTLWTMSDNVYINVLYNIILYPQLLFSQNNCTSKEYAIYKNVFNSKNYLPDVVILFYDENTQVMEDLLNDPFFKIQVYKIQMLPNMLNEMADTLSDVLIHIYTNYIDISSQFSYFEQCYANYNCINKKK